MTFGTGTVCGKSTKQKLNTRSSTETELVSVDDCMPQMLWTNLFMKEQGYSVGGTVAHQDNKSTAPLENDGAFSGSKRTKHIQARFYFITDQIEKGNVSIEWCPTKEMIADFFTKPLQGELFITLRNKIMGIQEQEHQCIFQRKRHCRSVLGKMCFQHGKSIFISMLHLCAAMMHTLDIQSSFKEFKIVP